MDRFYKADATVGQPLKVVNFGQFVAQELGCFVFMIMESCALVAWQLWKMFHPKSKA
jgi:hypothetical protein